MITGKDFLTLGDILVRGRTEAEWRSGVSRAYYAAFHEARQLLRDLGFQVPRGDQAHVYLSRRLSNCGNLSVGRAGSDMNALRGDRNRADYDVTLAFDQHNATIQVQTARQIIQVLDASRTEPTRTQITDAMKIYERDVLKQVTWGP